MLPQSSHNLRIKSIGILLAVLFCAPVFAAAENKGYLYSNNTAETQKEAISGVCSENESNLSELQKQARLYRSKGVDYQRIGDLDSAVSYYQKAIEIDPGYAMAYNDLGIIYEAQGGFDMAESCYLKAVKIDPNYLSSYSNLALFYESQRDLGKAGIYWAKRAELGVADDPWTIRARQRLNDIQLVLGDIKIDTTEQDAINLTKDVLVEKDLLKKDDKALARDHLEKAKLNYKKGNEIAAFNEAVNASTLDPANNEVDDFLNKLQTRLLSK